MLCSSVFATAPTLSDINWSPKIVNDLNYSKWTNTDFISIFSTVTGLDLNAKDCYWSVDAGDTWTRSSTDMNTDNNIITVSLNMPAVTNDINFGLKCINTSAEESIPVYQVVWLDETAPTTTPNTPSGNPLNIILTAVDTATTTGNGSGVKLTYYWVDSGTRQTSLVNPTTFSLTSVGSHTIYWCSVDRLDNNECTQTGIWSKSVYVGTIQNQSCGLLNLLTLLFAAIIVITILVLGLTGNLDGKLMIFLIVTAVAGVIGVVILGSFLVPFCGLP